VHTVSSSQFRFAGQLHAAVSASPTLLYLYSIPGGHPALRVPPNKNLNPCNFIAAGLRTVVKMVVEETMPVVFVTGVVGALESSAKAKLV